MRNPDRWPAGRRSPGRAILAWTSVVAWGVGVIIAGASPTRAQEAPLSVSETESLVRARYYEGLPVDQARRIGEAGCERLLGMLADPTEARHHGTILLAIGVCGPDGGLEAIEAWAVAMAADAGSGEIDRARFRAWQMLPFALGHLAEHDERAIDHLASRLDAAAAPAWRFRHHRGRVES